MAASELHTPLGQLVAERPAAAAVLDRADIDYCCGGDRTLAEACQEKDISAQEVLAAIAAEEAKADRRRAEREINWLKRPLAELCDHIEQTHHAYLKRELPRAGGLIDKVVEAHAERHAELHDVSGVFAGLRSELEAHMMKEEHILFPAIRQLEQSPKAVSLPFGSVANPIGVMKQEHDTAGDALKQLRSLTGGYVPPEDACNSYRAMLDALRDLEFDLHLHIHKENNILFPRAVELE